MYGVNTSYIRLRNIWPQYTFYRDRFARSVRIVPGPPFAAGLDYDSDALTQAERLREELLALMNDLGWPRRIAERVVKPHIGLQVTANDIRAALTGFRYVPKNGNGRFHGPAVDKAGRLLWYQDGRLHRDDGPAVVSPTGGTELWRNGVQY